MRIGVVPNTTGLYFAAGVASAPFKSAISATGIHETMCGARRRCAMELVERVELPEAINSRPPGNVLAKGTAAGHCQNAVEVNAASEAVERLLCQLWWTGQLPATQPLPAICQAAENWIAQWCPARPQAMAILALQAAGLKPVLVAISWSKEGRDLCFGMAAHKCSKSAAKKALREMIQMEFGLSVIRFRQRHGIAPSSREQAALARADGLSRSDIAALMPSADIIPQPAKLTFEEATESVRKGDVWLALTTLTGEPAIDPKRHAGHAGWALYL